MLTSMSRQRVLAFTFKGKIKALELYTHYIAGSIITVLFFS